MTRRAVLPNGLRVLAREADPVPTFSLVLSLEAGSLYDSPGSSGLASLVAGVLLEGTEHETESEFSRRVDSAGAVFDVIAGYETCTLSLTGLSDRFEEALAAVAEAVRRPRLEPDALERARRKQLAEIAEDDDDPFMLLRREFFDLVCGPHPRGRPVSGRPRTVRSLSLKDAMAFHRSHYVPSGGVLAVSGDLQPGSVVEAVARAFGDWPSGKAPGAVPAPPPAMQGERRFVRVDRNQTHVMVGGPGVTRTEAAYHPATVLDAILGDSAGFSCRLGRRLREADGLAYVVESDLVGTAGTEPGVVSVYTATSPVNARRALDAVIEELDRLHAEPPDHREVESAASYLLGRRRLGAETNEVSAGRLVRAERFGLGLDYDDRYPDIIGAVTAEDVAAVARRLLDPSHRSVAVAGPDPVD